jgi:hypothetical protein
VTDAVQNGVVVADRRRSRTWGARGHLQVPIVANEAEDFVSKQRQTDIDDIAMAGAELAEEQMRLATGGVYDLFIIGDCLVAFFYTGPNGEIEDYATSDPGSVEIFL